MDISQLWSTNPVGTAVGIAVAIVAIVIIVVVCCCCCYYCCNTNHTPRKSTYHGNWVTPSNLESRSLNGFELTIKQPNRRTKGDYSLINDSESETDLPEEYPAPTVNGNQERPESETDVPEEYPNLPTPTVSVSQERPAVTYLPHHFSDFIIDKIIPYFLNQRRKAYQFAVVVLLSENDFYNIYQTSFTPSRSDSGKPIVDNTFTSMPQDRADYGNYIVATPISNSYHSEEVLFGWNSVNNSPFSHLWSTYVKQTGACPKCILIYSWNLPCSRCTDVIIRSLREEPYNRVSVIVAHTTFWMLDLDRNKNKEKLIHNNITVQQVAYPKHISPANDY